MIIIKIIGIVIIMFGAIITGGAKLLVKKYNLDLKTKCEFENEMDEKELMEYKFNKALVNVKLVGMIVILPGIILTIYSFN